jgi:DNA-binding winged helix-turn-helix (wHTH) protein/tetratricopeptide (TPR) repeat protein
MEEADCRRFGEFRVDLQKRTLHRNGTPVALSRRAFDVLAYFVDHPGRVVTKEELLLHIWGDSSVDENNLTQGISGLRKALDQRADESSYVVTLAGRGYQFTARVEGGPAASDGSSHGAAQAVLQQTRSVRTTTTTTQSDGLFGAPRLGSIAIGLLLLAGGYGAWRWTHPPVPSGGIEVVLESFENSTGDAQFDQTLDRALQIDLEESPFVSLLSRSQVEESLVDMQHKRDAVLTHPLALEVCERNNAQATLQGTIARLGRSFLLAFEADSCVSGKRIAASKVEVANKDEVLRALDKGVDAIRRQLGESAASREHYETPISQATSASLDALRAYSLGQVSFDHGDMPGAQALFEQAVALDPKFASAFMSLGTTFLNRGDTEHASIYYKKAYDLRGHVSEGERLTIESEYFADGIGDEEEAIRRIKQFVAIYPTTDTAWVTLTNTYTELGEYPQAVDAGEHALHNDPHSGIAAEVLARAYERANRFADAKRVARAAIAEGKDHWGTHSILYQMAAFEHDAATVQTETAWMMSHPSLNLAYDDFGFAATLDGRLREGIDDFRHAQIESIRAGDPTTGELQQLNLARFQILFGETAEAAESLKQMKGDGGDLADKVLFQARVGDLAPAKLFVAKSGSPGESDTLSTQIGVPLAAAEVAMQEHKPLEAIRLLQPAKPYALNSFDIPFLRARAETEAGQLDAAAADYRLMLANPGIDPVAAEYWLAHLYLARVLALQHNVAAARAEYQSFVSGWKDADPDLPVLKAAKAELAKL